MRNKNNLEDMYLTSKTRTAHIQNVFDLKKKPEVNYYFLKVIRPHMI